MQVTEHVVRKSMVIGVPPLRAFDVFTNGFDSWWPRSHHTGEGDLVKAVIEPHQGGRWYAVTTVGEEEWGRVLVWDPPRRIVLDWQLNADFRYDADFHTDVEARFTAEGDSSTLFEFEHRDIERYGDRAEELAAALGSDGGWTGIMNGFAAAAQRPA